MGQKVHPYSLRLGIIRGWLSNWYADDKAYTEQLLEDIRLRAFIRSRLQNAGIARIYIERTANNVTITLHTSKPGVVIGRGGRGVDMLRGEIEALAKQKVQVNVEEIKRPELDAQLVAENIAQQIERRVSFRRAMKQSIGRTRRMGAQGMRVRCSGRLGGREIAYSEADGEGSVPLHTLRADIDYGMAEARTTAGRIGVKVWIYKGDIMPERPQPAPAARPEAEAQPVAVAEVAQPQLAVEPAPMPEPAPMVAAPEPASAEPEPASAEPEPASAEPEPASAEPAPARVEPAPMPVEPEPVAVEPEPVAVVEEVRPDADAP